MDIDNVLKAHGILGRSSLPPEYQGNRVLLVKTILSNAAITSTNAIRFTLDGNTVIFVALVESNYYIYKYNIPIGTLTNLGSPVAPTSALRNLAISDDGSIIYIQIDATPSTVYYWENGTFKSTGQVLNTSPIANIICNSDGSELYFSNSALYKWTKNTSVVTQITSPQAILNLLKWCDDGSVWCNLGSYLRIVKIQIATGNIVKDISLGSNYVNPNIYMHRFSSLIALGSFVDIDSYMNGAFCRINNDGTVTIIKTDVSKYPPKVVASPTGLYQLAGIYESLPSQLYKVADSTVPILNIPYNQDTIDSHIYAMSEDCGRFFMAKTSTSTIILKSYYKYQ